MTSKEKGSPQIKIDERNHVGKPVLGAKETSA